MASGSFCVAAGQSVAYQNIMCDSREMKSGVYNFAKLKHTNLKCLLSVLLFFFNNTDQVETKYLTFQF